VVRLRTSYDETPEKAEALRVVTVSLPNVCRAVTHESRPNGMVWGNRRPLLSHSPSFTPDGRRASSDAERLKRFAEGRGEFNRSVQHSMVFGCCSDRRCVGVATRGTQGLSSLQKKELWERWKAGESLTEIGRALQKRTGSIHWALKATGGFAPPQRRRSSRALSQAEREEISRGLAAGDSLRAIAARLGWAASRA